MEVGKLVGGPEIRQERSKGRGNARNERGLRYLREKNQ